MNINGSRHVPIAQVVLGEPNLVLSTCYPLKHRNDRWAIGCQHQPRAPCGYAICAPVVASSELLDGLDSMKAGLALGTFVGNFAPLQDTLGASQHSKGRTDAVYVGTIEFFVSIRNSAVKMTWQYCTYLLCVTVPPSTNECKTNYGN